MSVSLHTHLVHFVVFHFLFNGRCTITGHFSGFVNVLQETLKLVQSKSVLGLAIEKSIHTRNIIYYRALIYNHNYIYLKIYRHRISAERPMCGVAPSQTANIRM